MHSITATVRSNMSWLEYYHHVKNGDLVGVKEADKDFRVNLTADKSALQLAAIYGHRNLVDYFLGKVDKTEDAELILELLKESLRGGNVDVVKTVLNFLGPVTDLKKSYVDVNVVCAAICGRNVDCLKLVWDLTDVHFRDNYAGPAFCSGSFEVIQFIHEFSTYLDNIGSEEENSDSESARTAHDWPVDPEDEYGDAYQDYKWWTWSFSYSFIALDEYERVLPADKEKLLTDKADKCEVEMDDKDYAETFSLLDVSGYFGHVNILKIQIEELKKRPNFDEASLKNGLESVFKFALRNNHTSVLEYLIEEKFVQLKPPYEFLHFRMNDAFRWLRDKTGELKTMGSGISDTFRKNLDNLPVLYRYRRCEEVEDTDVESESLSYKMDQDHSGSVLTKIEKYYEYLLDACGEQIQALDLGQYFMEALSEQNVDAALCFLRRLENKKVSCLNTSKYHELLLRAISALDSFNILTSPVIVELALSTMSDGICSCAKKVNALHDFLTLRKEEPNEGFPLYKPLFKHPLDLYLRRTEAVLQVFFDNGLAKPSSKLITDMIFSFFCGEHNKHAADASKVLGILACTNLNVNEVRIRTSNYDSVDWFLEEFPKRDQFLTELLIALYRNQFGCSVSIDGFRAYLLDPTERQNHFLNCMMKTGILVHDGFFRLPHLRHWIHLSIREHHIDNYYEMYKSRWSNSIHERVPSLQEWSRYALHHHYLREAHDSRSFVSVKTLVARASRDLPVVLQKYLRFADVYETLDYEQDLGETYRHPIERLRNLIPSS